MKTDKSTPENQVKELVSYQADEIPGGDSPRSTLRTVLKYSIIFTVLAVYIFWASLEPVAQTICILITPLGSVTAEPILKDLQD